MSVDKYYANGRVAVMSTRLFGADKFARIAESATVDEALKVLYESGYGGGLTVENSNDYENLLKAELSLAVANLRELSSDDYVTRYFTAKYDYFNAKALIKSKYMRIDGSEYCFECASIPVAQMQKAINSDDYESFPKYMAEALEQCDEEFAAGGKSPRKADVAIDKAMYRELAAVAKKCRFAALKKYHEYDVFCVNLLTMLRVKKAGQSREEFAETYVEGGLPIETMLERFDEGAEKLTDDKRLAALIAEGAESGSFAAAENYVNKRKMQILTENPDVFTVAPLVAYFLRKTEEIDKIRFAFICIKNGVDVETIKERLK